MLYIALKNTKKSRQGSQFILVLIHLKVAVFKSSRIASSIDYNRSILATRYLAVINITKEFQSTIQVSIKPLTKSLVSLIMIVLIRPSLAKQSSMMSTIVNGALTNCIQ